jgi:hypothetical protein
VSGRSTWGSSGDGLDQAAQLAADLVQLALAEPATQTEALEIVRGLIERVVLHPAEKGFEIELIGEIANMVDLGAQAKAAGPKGAAVSNGIDSQRTVSKVQSQPARCFMLRSGLVPTRSVGRAWFGPGNAAAR